MRTSENLLIDSTIVRAHACAALSKRGKKRKRACRSRGGFSSKVHTITDGLGNPLGFTVTPGQTHDMTIATMLTMLLEKWSCECVIAELDMMLPH